MTIVLTRSGVDVGAPAMLPSPVAADPTSLAWSSVRRRKQWRILPSASPAERVFGPSSSRSSEEPGPR